MSGHKEVLVVTVPAGTLKLDEFGRFREYVIESILRDVLVLDDGMACDIREMPAVDAVPVTVEMADPKTLAKAVHKPGATLREEKQKILSRLLERRERMGAGAFNDVARECKAKAVTADVLRLLVAGDATLEAHEWRAIGKALDRLEGTEQEGRK